MHTTGPRPKELGETPRQHSLGYSAAASKPAISELLKQLKLTEARTTAERDLECHLGGDV